LLLSGRSPPPPFAPGLDVVNADVVLMLTMAVSITSGKETILIELRASSQEMSQIILCDLSLMSMERNEAGKTDFDDITDE